MKLIDKETLSKREAMGEKFFGEMKDTFFFQVHRIQKLLFRRWQQMFQEASIPIQLEQFPILLTIYAHDKLSQQEIADITQRDKSSIQRSLVTLERKGMLRITPDENDKRKNLVSITEAGTYLSVQIREILRQAEAETFAIFSESERATAIEGIKAIADKLEQNS